MCPERMRRERMRVKGAARFSSCATMQVRTCARTHHHMPAGDSDGL